MMAEGDGEVKREAVEAGAGGAGGRPTGARGSRLAKRWRSRARRRRNRAASSALRNALSGRRRLRRAPGPLELYWGEIA